MELGRKKCILIFTDWYEPAIKAGGPVRSIANLVELMKDEFQFNIVCSDRDYGDTSAMKEIQSGKWIEQSGIRIWYLKKEQRERKTIKNIIKETDYDILYIQGLFSYYFSIFPIIYAPSNKITIVAPRGMLHESALRTGLTKKWKKYLFLNAMKWLGYYKNVIFHSTQLEESREIEMNLGYHYFIKEAENIPDVMERVQFGKNKIKGKLRALCLGRISEEKGSILLIKFIQNMEGIQVDFAGSYSDKYYFQSFLASLKELNGKANYLGVVGREELRKMWRNYDILVSASLGENFGHAIAEAMQSGLPVLIGKNTPWKFSAEKKGGINSDLNEMAFRINLEFFRDLDISEMQEWSDAAVKIADEKNNRELWKQQYRKLFE